ncbi:acyltransferase [Novosphingobium sp.]|uniref:acyltransferase family protein n=1 Tax=Novosphingobium sp. TaxID=1874826 RepID=UPI0025DADE9E|nr:acyltransferase [Novosphingobium sp.]
MSRGLSIYLDFLRLIAAVEVFVFHLAAFGFTGLHRAPWNAYGHEAVTIFFVLSGFVIRHAVQVGDPTIAAFATSRLARVYSVAVPCLLLTFAFDLIGHRLAPDFYDGLTTTGSSLFRLAIGGAMLNEAWVSVQMLSNTPYWSISYEFWYYVLFAALFYLKGGQRVLATLAAAIIAGPKILLLFPIWLMGWLAYVEHKSERMPMGLSVALFAQPVVMLAAFERLHLSEGGRHVLEVLIGHDAWRNGLAWSRYVISDSILGASIALHLVGAKRLGPPLWAVLAPVRRPIRFLASRSFTLYLLHQPALLMVAACLAAVPLGPWRSAAIAAVTLVVILLVAMITEGQRRRVKPTVAALVERIAGLGSRRAAQQPEFLPGR